MPLLMVGSFRSACNLAVSHFSYPPPKVVVCGDTADASHIAPLATDCDVLVHEATNAFLSGKLPLFLFLPFRRITSSF